MMWDQAIKSAEEHVVGFNIAEGELEWDLWRDDPEVGWMDRHAFADAVQDACTFLGIEIEVLINVDWLGPE